jgi:hypothetical protein
MELLEIVFALILGLVGIISSVSAWVVRAIMSDVKELEHTMTSCQTNMPRDYVLKADYRNEASEIKSMISEQSKKIDQIWKHMRISSGKD